ncbi:MAG: acyl carrier protein [Bacteroidia bacterium]|nr:acyl carrier protein [Bacteroidia bacterium]
MTFDQIIHKTNVWLADEFEVDESSLTPDANLKDALDLDSLDYVDIVAGIESIFGFKVKTEDFKSIVSLQDFYDFIAKRVGNAEPA